MPKKQTRANRSTGKKNPTQAQESVVKKSFRRSWRAASPINKTGVVFAGLAALATLGYLAVSIWQTLENKQAARAQHMPLVINSRAPELLQPFVCDVKNGLHTGNMRNGMKNIGTASAYQVMPFSAIVKIVPEKKTGDQFVDEIPDVNCGGSMSAKELESPLPPGRELQPQLRQMVVSVPPIAETDPVQLYWVNCVYYADEYGGRHATCDRYRLTLPSDNQLDALSGSPTFYCDAKPRTGRFDGTIGGHCQQ